MQTIPSGWYNDGSGRERWWDGDKWTERFKDKAQASAPTPLIKPIEELAQEHLRKTWLEGYKPGLEPFVLENQNADEPLKITFFNGKKQALELQNRLDTTRERLGAVTQELADKAKEAAEYKNTLEAIDGLDILEVERLVRSTRAVYDQSAKDINAQLSSMREKLDIERKEKLLSLENETADLKAEVKKLFARRSSLLKEVIELDDAADLQRVGYYDYDNPAQSSVQLSADLNDVRAQIKEIQKKKEATTATSGFTFNNSTAQGTKFVKDMSNLLLRSYNAEAENCIKSVKAGNLTQATARLEKAKEQAEKLGSMISLRISTKFHKLRIREMELANSHLQALAVEKELERERREELREAKRVEDELARKRKQLEDELKREREKYQRSVAALQERGDTEAIARMDAEIIEIEKGIEDVEYRAANLKAGYVYIISNIGAFGEGIVKIGLTRRLDPLDRVKELSGASVPFRFDVHAIIFSNDAPALEASLHRHFASKKVNKANPRKEFFHTTPQEVLNALKNDKVEVLEFVLEPEAEEWRVSQSSN